MSLVRYYRKFVKYYIEFYHKISKTKGEWSMLTDHDNPSLRYAWCSYSEVRARLKHYRRKYPGQKLRVIKSVEKRKVLKI